MNNPRNNNPLYSTQSPIFRLCALGMLSAVSILLVTVIHFPLFPGTAAYFLVYDPADIFIILATFLFGPISGLIMTITVSVVQGLTVSTEGGFLGIVMHIAATGSYVLVAGLLFRRKKSWPTALLAMLAGTLTMTVTTCLFNLLIVPLFLGWPRQEVIKMLLPFFIPFNLFKASLNSIFAFILLRSVPFLHKLVFRKSGYKE